MIVVTGYESHRKLTGRTNILNFLNWLSNHVAEICISYENSREVNLVRECQKVLRSIVDANEQVSSYADEDTTEYGINLCEGIGVKLIIRSSFCQVDNLLNGSNWNSRENFHKRDSYHNNFRGNQRGTQQWDNRRGDFRRNDFRRDDFRRDDFRRDDFRRDDFRRDDFRRNDFRRDDFRRDDFRRDDSQRDDLSLGPIDYRDNTGGNGYMGPQWR